MGKNFKKRGQGALEFLMTYGWAFLVILIMIGALAYFGVLDPYKFLPDRCQFGTNVACQKDAYVINNEETDTIIANLVNNFGSNVKVYNATVTTDYGSLVCDSGTGGVMLDGTPIDNIADADNAIDWADGDVVPLTVNCTNGDTLSEGDKVKFKINFKWYSASSTSQFAKDASGEIFSTVQ